MFQWTVSGQSGQAAVKHVDQGRHQDLFWFLQNMEARIAQAEEEDTAMQQYAQVRKTLQEEFKSFQNPIKKNPSQLNLIKL